MVKKICIVDTREPEKIAKKLNDEFIVSRQFLEFGDVFIPPRLGIERKTATDLLHTMKEGRLLSQIAGLIETYPIPVLLIEGSLHPDKSGMTVANGRGTGWKWASVQAMLWRLQAHGVILVTVRSSELVNAVVSLSNIADDIERKINPLRHINLKIDRGEAILSLFPYIGEKTAHRLMRYAGTLGWSLAALTDDETRIAGVGPKARKEARKLLGLNDNEMILIVQREEQ